MTITRTEQVISETAVRQLVDSWHESLDRHHPTDNLLRLLATAGMLMQLPDRTLRSHSELREWHENLVNSHFDEAREVVDLRVKLLSPLHADVGLRVRWQARTWRPPAAHSDWLGCELSESWSVVLQDGVPRIRTRIVDSVAPMPGSAPPRATA